MDEQTKIAHLLRRAGFGAGPDQLPGFLQKGLAATADELLDVQRVADNLDVTLAEAGLNDPQPPGSYGNDLPRWWLNTMSTTNRPLQEKMVLFWHHLFATGADKDGMDLRAMYLQNQMFRGNYLNGVPAHSDSFPMGSFRKILEDLAKDPAMLFFLDNWINVKVSITASSNENWGRELMELFSLGVRDVLTEEANYTEDDVRQVARAFTGWSVHLSNPKDNFYRRFEFQPRGERGNQTARVHDFGPYRLSSYFKNAVGGDQDPAGGGWVLDRITERRSAGRFIAFRLFSFFGYDNPETEIVEALTDIYFSSKYSIHAMLAAMFVPGTGIVSEAFYSDRALKAKVKSPVEFALTSWRFLGGLQFPARISDELVGARSSRWMENMGQRLFYPPDVSGWKEGLEWINTTFDIARFNYANSLATLSTAQGGIPVETILTANNLKTPEQIVDHFAGRLLQSAPSAETRDNLIKYMRAQDNGTPAPTFVLNQTTINKKVRGLIHLILTMPEFQLN